MANQQEQVIQLKENGITILPSVFSQETVKILRNRILENTHLMKHTRSANYALHLASFHRYPELEKIHSMISCNDRILQFLRCVIGNKNKVIRSIGNSDIAINRSQQWHKDLLRGKYAHYHTPENIWNEDKSTAYRIIFYLQESKNLQIVQGSHLVPQSLESDQALIPSDDAKILQLHIQSGDVVIMDIRTTHRGMTDEYVNEKKEPLIKHPSILVATVLGSVDSYLTLKMEEGNSYRLRDWDEKYNAA